MYHRLRRHKAAALTIDLPGVSGFPSDIVPYSKKISTGMFRRVHRLLGVTQVRATTSSSHVCQTGKKSRTYQLQSVALLCVASSLLSRESIFACQQCQATHGVRKHPKKRNWRQVASYLKSEYHERLECTQHHIEERMHVYARFGSRRA
jgi:hypothetical protein